MPRKLHFATDVVDLPQPPSSAASIWLNRRGAAFRLQPRRLNRRIASLPLALLVSLASSASLYPPPAALSFGTRFASLLHPSLIPPSGSIVAVLRSACNPGGSIVASLRCRSRCSFRSLPPLRFIRHRRRSASEPVSPASFTPPSSATGGVGVTEPQAGSGLRSHWRRFGYGASKREPLPKPSP